VDEFIAPADLSLARSLRDQILLAPVEAFKPQIWKIDLSKVANARWNTSGANPAWDEQFVTDLNDSEYAIVID
jgi:hypothetical protein